MKSSNMKMFVNPPRLYLYREPVDFRKAIDGLALVVEQDMELSPFEESVFIFCNKGRDKIKVLYWDKTGFCLWYKRLEKQRFKWPQHHPEAQMLLTSEQWESLLAGFPLIGHQTLNFTSLS